ncbi:sigma-54-dependent Fis family transcriptional regulator [Parabacteroides acidifaciens]|uniref:Sigma-54-dependent Fis family transcriptional regulator n=1 Tax=Parabacteroides acidifaciens TaxID=2290935 RepID=A0A3D8HBB3_9BACT|nr:sigma-54 dependent transcriptional regulator [Parabacteroides acidifaciens]MBC8603425.1 sigma-54-dependent Fis family transcriptional regulator [Parabacteroides acidifaciens]RDU47837.1 sigma-54-dependent Fis family transcriptional regulator [Parabacteroides acidifaciens]
MATRQGKILIVDDNEDILFTLKMLLRPRVESITTCSDPKEINRLVSRNQYDVVLLDMNFTADAVSGKEGFYWLERILEISPGTVVILITAYSDTEKAVRAIKAGATDFIPKPWQNEKMLATVSTALELSLSRSEVRTLKEQKSALTASEPEIEIIGESAAMQNVFRTLEKLKDTDTNILLQGENGTGKDLIAYTLHQQSVRGKEPFVPIDLGSIPHELFESELFGHEKGAFTDADKSKPGRIEIASGGTLFLNEIGNLPLMAQSKLLTVIEQRKINRVGSTQETPVDIRLISATNTDLHAAVQKGRFRQDLLYRINTIEITIPPLRERGNDVTLLARHFLQRYSRKYKKEIKGFSGEAQQLLKQYHWPGNVRELQHVIERAVILSEAGELQYDDFMLRLPVSASQDKEGKFNLEELEKNTIREVLRHCSGNMTQAAGLLGITRTSLYRRLEKYGL